MSELQRIAPPFFPLSEDQGSDPLVSRPAYSAPRLTVYGDLADDPQKRARFARLFESRD